MKKGLRLLALTLALSMLMCMAVFAGDEELFVDVNDKATFAMDESGEKFTVTYTGATSGEHLILMVSNSDGGTNYTINEQNIQYVDQATATATGITFTIHPIKMMDAKIILAGPDGVVVLGYYKHPEPDVLLGDVNLDGTVNSIDTNLLFRYVMKKLTEGFNSNQLFAADVNEDGGVNSIDTNLLFRYVMKKVPSLGAQ